uniref:Uncharacterized protein n=1 Tax=Octactis speculum TaxID=3111310 RepID=A0A6U3VYV6_9STRA|mmetsp:Transcript_48541/g.66089  ORF Transcript_48541/g.66089 Transcript_48541/m.66089 type:complete len:152 (+) Transcript_48541:14-469(+)
MEIDKAAVVKAAVVTATVVTAQPTANSGGAQEEKFADLCSCFDDKGLCCFVCCCPACAFGEIAEGADYGSCCLCGAAYSLCSVVSAATAIFLCGWTVNFGCPLTVSARGALRRKYNIEGSCCMDCVMHCCCFTCATCQELKFVREKAPPKA